MSFSRACAGTGSRDRGPHYDQVVRLVVVTAGEDGRSQITFDGPPGPARLLSGAADALSAASRVISADHTAGPSETLVAQLVGDSRMLPMGTFRSSPDRRRSLDLPVGANRWTFVSYGPGVTAHIHETATVDYDMVLSGSVELLLDCGAITLSGGDAVVLVGARHGWRTTDRPCTLSIVMVGLPVDPPAS
jgi:hypothetical protein